MLLRQLLRPSLPTLEARQHPQSCTHLSHNALPAPCSSRSSSWCASSGQTATSSRGVLTRAQSKQQPRKQGGGAGSSSSTSSTTPKQQQQEQPKQQQPQKQQQEKKQTQQQWSPADYLSPFSAVDPNITQQPQQQPKQDTPPPAGVDADKWEDVLATKHTLSSLYLTQFEVDSAKQRNWEARRQEKDLAEVAAAGKRLGISADAISANLAQLQALVPGLLINLDRMKAGDWARLLAGVQDVVAVVICLKGHYPKLDLASVIGRRPRLLLASREAVDRDAAEVKALLLGSGKVQDVDAIMEAVPDLLAPAQLRAYLASLTASFPRQDPFELLQTNPGILESPNEEPDPTYGRAFWDNTGG